MTDTELFIENNIRDFNDILSIELQFCLVWEVCRSFLHPHVSSPPAPSSQIDWIERSTKSADEDI